MAELAENILQSIKNETSAQNDVLVTLLKQSKDQHLEIKDLHTSDDRADKKSSEYEQKQQGIENQFAKVQQFLQEKTQKGIDRQSDTDTVGIFSDKDISKISLPDDQEAIRVVDIMGSSKDAEISERLGDLQKKEQFAQEKTKERAEKQEQEAGEEKALLKGILDAQLNTFGKTMGTWFNQGKDRLQEIASFDNFKGALKTDMNLMMGKLQLLTQLPGVTSLMQGIKFILGSILAFFINRGFGRALEPLIQSIENFAVNFLGKSVEDFAKAREAREKLYTAREKGKGVVEEGGKIKSAAGKDVDKSSPQGKMIWAMQKRTNDLTSKWQTAWVKTQVFISNNMKESTKFVMKKIFGPIGKVFKSMAGAVGKAVMWLVPIITAFIIQIGLFIAQMGLLIGGFILANLPIIALVVGIGLLVFGILWLVAYVITEWENIKSKFNEEWEVIKMKWGAFSFAEWFDNGIQSLVLAVKNLWFNIINGLMGFINDTIMWWNDKMPGDVFDIDWRAPKFGDTAAREEEGAALSAKKNAKAENLAAKEKEIRDRHAAERGGGATSSVNAPTVVNTQQSKNYVASGTRPSDAFAANMASSSPSY